MRLGKKNSDSTIKCISNLWEMTYEPENEELNHIHQRLVKGKKSFEQAVLKTMDAMISMSSMDLILETNATTIEQINTSISDSVDSISESASSTANIAIEVSKAHENLTTSIIGVSEESNKIMQEISNCEDELNAISGVSTSVISTAEEMKTNMHELVHIIENMSEVIEEITSISTQTNLLALNASIEAARAGDLGKGFSVVAEEIRRLAEQTRTLTGNIRNSLTNIQEASQKSSNSVDVTVSELGNINNSIQNIWGITGNNRTSMSNIADSVSSLAAVSEEISSSMNELEEQTQHVNGQCQKLKENTDSLTISSKAITELVEPAKKIEQSLDKSTKIMGEMARDAFYMLDNQVILNCLNSAINTHKAWLNTLKDMAQTGKLKVLQTDCTKCGLGHFYYAFKPLNSKVTEVWNGLDSKHKAFHLYGTEMISAIQSNRTKELQKIYDKAEACSKDLLSDFQTLIRIIESLTREHIRIFE